MRLVVGVVEVVFRSPRHRLAVYGARQVGDGVGGPGRRDGRQPATAAGIPATAVDVLVVGGRVARPTPAQHAGRFRSAESGAAAAVR